jgi:sugar/nucleoside kinase (ribokinase family)
MLKRAKSKGCITVVNTVYDFINEKKHPEQRWPMGEGDESYRFIDLLIVDCEEAFRLSGCNDIPSSIAFFREKGTGAVLVTNGARNISLWADSPLFGKVEEQTMPVSAAVGQALKQGKKGDSTGCGDNFAGGVIGSLAKQMAEGTSLDLKDATRWGIVSGGFACFYYGGTYFEQKEGEKLTHLQELYDKYLEQEGAC